MNKIKSVVIAVLTVLAVALGTAVFILYKLFTHERELNDARTFLSSAPYEARREVLRGLDVKQGTFEETAHSLRDEIEKETKNEIITNFKKAFGVSPSVDRSRADFIDDDGGSTAD